MLCALVLALKVATFSEISTKEEKSVVFFYNSQNKQDGVELDKIKSLESLATEFQFYGVDKADSANSDVFKHEIFANLPQLFVLLPEEHYSEPLIGNYSFERAKEFLSLKITQVNVSKPHYVSKAEGLTQEDGFVLFIGANCQQCDMALLSVARAAQFVNASFRVVNCSVEEELCVNNSVLRIPKVWYALDGVFSQANSYTSGWCFEEFKAAHGADRETRKTRPIQKDEPVEPADEAQEYEPIDTEDLESKIQRLEKKAGELEQQLEKLSAPAKTEL